MGCPVAIVKPIPEKHISGELDDPKLEYAVAGEGRPIIVFLSGYGTDMDTAWSKVYPEAGKISTVFAYNRLGYGGSDKADEAQTGAVIVATLRDLLHKNGLNPPYVLVGHSIGGLYANLFARSHPLEISGIVLVDSAHPDQQKMLRIHEGVVLRVVSWVLNALDSAIHSRHSEISSFNETAGQIEESGPFPAIPLMVISAGKPPPSWLARHEVIRVLCDNQRSLAAMSPNGKQIIAERSGHFVQNDEPEIVIQAIRTTVDKSRSL
jgi:pimeloyl-ACP methyl ester carboxylesterase